MRLKIYTTSQCPNCVKLKNWLKENDYKYEEINVDTNFKGKALLISKGFMGVPIVCIEKQRDSFYKGGNLEEIIEFIKC
jgi:glutaredoxin 3